MEAFRRLVEFGLCVAGERSLKVSGDRVGWLLHHSDGFAEGNDMEGDYDECRRSNARWNQCDGLLLLRSFYGIED